MNLDQVSIDLLDQDKKIPKWMNRSSTLFILNFRYIEKISWSPEFKFIWSIL